MPFCLLILSVALVALRGQLDTPVSLLGDAVDKPVVAPESSHQVFQLVDAVQEPVDLVQEADDLTRIPSLEGINLTVTWRRTEVAANVVDVR